MNNGCAPLTLSQPSSAPPLYHKFTSSRQPQLSTLTTSLPPIEVPLRPAHKFGRQTAERVVVLLRLAICQDGQHVVSPEHGIPANFADAQSPIVGGNEVVRQSCRYHCNAISSQATKVPSPKLSRNMRQRRTKRRAFIVTPSARG